MTSVADHGSAAERERAVGYASDIARDIVRGGLAGVVAGLVVGGLGGRLMMRLAALLVPYSVGQLTDNGREIGAFTFEGTAALMVFGGLFGGLAAGIVWVTVSPWIPGTGIRRAVLTMPIAVALSGFWLIDGDNRDFVVLRHDTLVVASILGLIALLGLVIAWLDDVFERWLPRVGGRPAVGVGYAVLVIIGLLWLPYVVGRYFEGPSTLPVGVALFATGIATLLWWLLRLSGQRIPPRYLLFAGRTALLAAVVFGVARLTPEVVDALGLGWWRH
jgi:hypothetical protein